MYLIIGMQITGWAQMEPPLGSYANHPSSLNAWHPTCLWEANGSQGEES